MDDFLNGLKCPVCHARFFEDDDIVYCPTCGAPHHRECWKISNHCAFENTHGTPNQWVPKKQENNDDPNELNANHCPTCKKAIPNDSLFCPYCGHDFVSGNRGSNPNIGFPPFGNMGGNFGANFNFTIIDPLGGVDENTDISGVSAKTAAMFVRTNSHRYIPIFAKKNEKNKPQKIGWNWSAFLFPEYWLVYRKCYVASIFAFIISLSANLLFYPFQNALTNMLPEGYTTPDIYNVISTNFASFSQSSIILMMIGFGLLLTVRIIYAMFGDYIYRTHTVNKIKYLIDNNDSFTFEELLRKKGNVNPFAPLIAYMIVETASILVFSFI